MKTEKINQLISKYFGGETTLNEEQKLREYLRRDDLPNEMQPYADLFRFYKEINDMETSQDFDPLAKIESKIDPQKSPSVSSSQALREGREGEEGSAGAESKGFTDKANRPESNESKLAAVESMNSRVLFDPFNSNSEDRYTWTLRIAAGFILLLVGFAAGQLMNSNGEEYASTLQVAALEQEVQQMKEVLMNGGDYENASAGERLSAVHISTHIPADDERPDLQITDILVYTMNNDKSVNVRIAAAEALFRFRNDGSIKKALIQSLSRQIDPLMQITLIDMLVEIKARGAINEMQKLLVNSETQEIVKERLQAGIAELKV